MLSLRNLAVLVLLLLMEILAGFAVIVGSSILDGTSSGYALFWLLMTAGVFGIALSLLVALVGPGEPWNRLILLTGGTVAVSLCAILSSDGVVAGIITAVLIALAYWRGLAVTQEPPDYAEVQRRFGFGFGILFLGIIWVIARGVIYQRPIWSMLALTGIGYTITAMIALATARLAQHREPGATVAVMTAVVLQIGCLMVISIVALELFAIDITGWLGHLLEPVLALVGHALGLIAGLLLTPIAWLVDQVRPHAHQGARLQPHAPFNPHGNGRKLRATPTSDTGVLAIGIVLTALVFSGIGFLIWRVMPQISRHSKAPGYTEERHSLWTLKMLWLGLLSWFRTLFRQGSEAAEHALQTARHRVLGGPYPADPVRRVYVQMLRRVETQGLRRVTSTTPEEFQEQIARRWPEISRDSLAITEAYVQRRYGSVTFDEHQLQQLRNHWHALRPILQRRSRQEPVPQVSESSTFSLLFRSQVSETSPAASTPVLDVGRRAGRWVSAVAQSGTTRMVQELGKEATIWLVSILTPIIFLGVLLIIFLLSGR